jgi:hypothetical protein
VDALLVRDTGLHISELAVAVPAVAEFLRFGVDASTVAILVTQGSPIKLSTGRYLYLAVWGGPRRPTILTALNDVLLEAPEAGLNFDDIVEQVASRVGRSVQRTAISSSLQAAGARWDEVSNRWKPSLEDSTEISDEPLKTSRTHP